VTLPGRNMGAQQSGLNVEALFLAVGISSTNGLLGHLVL